MAITKKKSSTAKKSSSGVTTLPYKGGTPSAQKLPYTGGTPSIQKLPYKGGTSSIKKASGGSSTKKSGTSVDKKSVLGLGYGPVSSKTLANKVSSGAVKASASPSGSITFKKATSPRGAGATTPSTAAKTSSKLSRKLY